MIFTPEKNDNPVDIYYTPGDIVSTSNALLDKNDRLHKIEHPTWLNQLAGTGMMAGLGAVVCGPACAAAGGLSAGIYNQFLSPNAFHTLSNYLPKSVFPLEEIKKNRQNKIDYVLKNKPFSSWLYPVIPQVPINSGRTQVEFNKMCRNPTDPKCKKMYG